jgi:tetratricopeptide (TPR) repeat protein
MDYNQLIKTGDSCYENKQLAEAQKYYTQAITLQPGQVTGYIRSGTVKYLLKDITGSIADYSHAIAIKPSEIAHYRLAVSQQRLGRYSEAIENFTSAIAFDCQNPKSYLGRSLVKLSICDLTASEDKSQAIQIFDQAGWNLIRSGEHQKALAQFEMVLKIESYNIKAQRGIDFVFAQVGFKATSIENCLKEAKETEQLGLLPKSLDLFSQTVMLDANCFEGYTGMIRVLELIDRIKTNEFRQIIHTLESQKNLLIVAI